MAVSRLAKALFAAALALAPAMALAQQAPGNDAVGPQSLQNFSLGGTVTRPADQSPAVAATRKPQPTKPEARSAAGPNAATAPATRRTEVAAAPAPAPPRPRPTSSQATVKPPAQRVSEAVQQAPAPPPVSAPLPQPAKARETSRAPAPGPAFAPPAAAPIAAPGRGFTLFPWLFAALVLGAGGAFLFWRNRRQQAPAGPLFDLFAGAEGSSDAAAEPEPALAPAPQPAKPGRAAPVPPEPLFDLFAPSNPAPRQPEVRPEPAVESVATVTTAPKRTAPASVVSTSLRPWVEIGFQPLRCIIEEHQVRVEFEIELFNSGSSPARELLVEATLINAGPAQDEQIAAFFANPVGAGERLAVIPPLKRLTFKSQVVVPREQVQAYEVGGREVFVPLIVFNALYRWSGGGGQTSVSYLLGRDTKGEKLAPFRLDLGPRIFRGLAARPLPAAARN